MVRPRGRDLSATLPSLRSEVGRAEKGEEQDSGSASADAGACVGRQAEERRQREEEGSGECAVGNGGDWRPTRPAPAPPTGGTGCRASSEVQRDQRRWLVGTSDQSNKHLRPVDESEDSKDRTEDEPERVCVAT